LFFNLTTYLEKSGSFFLRKSKASFFVFLIWTSGSASTARTIAVGKLVSPIPANFEK
jgi:hypothetical protein